MRPSSLRARAAIVAAGALCIAATPGAAHAQTPGTTTVRMGVEDRTLRFGQRADVRGRVAGAGARRPVTLQLGRSDGTWLALAHGRTGADGRFRLRAAVPATGPLRVVAHAAGDAQARAAEATGGTPAASPPRRVAVAADVVPHRRRLNVLAGRRAVLRGAIRPAAAGRRVVLQRRSRGRWATVARARTGASGAFALRARVRTPLSAPVRVHVAGGDGLVAARKRVGRLNVFRRALVSWYGPGLYGNHLGCGGTLRPGRLGVAHKTLPCGTRLTLRHGRRMVRVSVIDRGPYAGGREFDLTAATKDRLRFGGVGTVLVTR
ncbi:MAG TPA: septal ring lytic transglycosylase RlpA family protein [Solirubrobacteraceae bacterium]|nr:septal ring lytic transglycosylase RlpA family protein [Solirubrobacteraceae bacterium]